jgi:hypothetical protein
MNERIRVLQRQPKRISITLSYHVHEALLTRSEEEGRSVSNLCAFLLEEALRDQQRNLTPQPSGNGHVHGHGHGGGPSLQTPAGCRRAPIGPHDALLGTTATPLQG